MSHKLITTLNAHTRDLLAEYEVLTGEQIRQRVDRAQAAFIGWKSVGIEQRTELLRSLAGQLRESKEENSRLMTLEMGKPIAQAESEIEKCAVLCEFYAEQGPGFLQPEFVPTDAARSYIRYDPLGVILAVMPWNFPFWQVFRFAVPTLLAGNAGLLKHASNVAGCAIAIEKLFADAGFPADLFLNLTIRSDQVEQVLHHEAVRGCSLTGSETAGRAVAEIAGRLLKPCVLELGGSDPFIVLDDADIELAVENAVRSRTINNGQSCIAAKRFIVCPGIYTDFTSQFVTAMKQLQVGDPLDRETDIGPLARRDLVDVLDKQVRKSIDQGAVLNLGGKPLDDVLAHYPATVLTEVEPGMTAFDEETFGPVAAIVRAKDVDHALRLANLSSYGLGGSLWTQDLQQAEQLATRLESGCVFINEMTKSDPRVPFGGIKHSGHGRELGRPGIHEFVNRKTVWIR